jgi:hypothetical protein
MLLWRHAVVAAVICVIPLLLLWSALCLCCYCDLHYRFIVAVICIIPLLLLWSALSLYCCCDLHYSFVVTVICIIPLLLLWSAYPLVVAVICIIPLVCNGHCRCCWTVLWAQLVPSASSHHNVITLTLSVRFVCGYDDCFLVVIAAACCSKWQTRSFEMTLFETAANYVT